MKKFFVISDKVRRGFTWNLARKVFEHKDENFSSPEEVISFLESTTPDFVYVELRKEIAEEDLLAAMKNLDDFSYLTFTTLNLSSFKSLIFRIVPFFSIDYMIEFLIENKAIKRLEQMLARK